MTFPLFLIKLYSDFTIFVVCSRLSDSGDDALVEEITGAGGGGGGGGGGGNHRSFPPPPPSLIRPVCFTAS